MYKYLTYIRFVKTKGASFMTSLILFPFLLHLLDSKILMKITLIYLMSLNKSELIKINLLLRKLQKKKIITKAVRLAYWDLVNEVQHFGKFHIFKTKLSDLLEVQCRQIERYLLYLEEIGLVFRDYTTHNAKDRDFGNSLYLTLIHPKEIFSYHLFYGRGNIRQHLLQKRNYCEISDIVCISNPDIYLKNYRFNQALDYAVKPESSAPVKPESSAPVKPESSAPVKPESSIKFLAKIDKGEIEVKTIKYLSYKK